MARPTKQGIDYFPLDVQFDEKVELFIAETGAEGLGVLVTVWQLIYQNKGYYIDNGSDLYLLIRRRVMSDLVTIETVVNSAIERGIFDKIKHREHKILTSKAIQNRYFIGAKKKKIVNVDENYICNGVSVGGNASKVSGNATKVEVEVEVEVEKKAIKKPANKKILFKEFLARCKELEEKPIPENDGVFTLAEKSGVSVDMLRICWLEFADKYSTSTKKYINWRLTFQNCIRDNWYELWYADHDGKINLTSKGRLAVNRQTKND